VLISANGGVITVKSEQEGQAVAVYTADGKALGSATVKDGQATVATNIQRGEIVIVKVGGRSVKVKM
jgi:endonuclease YncB( thermonuclease family)